VRPECEGIRDMLDAYALGATEAYEAKMIEEHVADCVRCWDELSKGQRTAALIALTAPIEVASPKLGERIIARAQRERFPREERSTIWGRLRTWPAAAGALGAASVAAFMVTGFLGMQVHDLHDKNDSLEAQLGSTTTALQKQLAETNEQLADQRSISAVLSDDHRIQVDVTAPGGNSTAEAFYTWSPDAHKGFMICDNLPSLPADKVYQVWVITDADQSIPMATFTSTDGTCQATMDYAGVTFEGHPTGIGVTAEQAPGATLTPHTPWLLYAHL
jgi:anti-sigma factor RsiW